MCLSHFSGCQDHTTDICLYVPFCIVFVILGIVQIISGIFYFITIPVIKLIVNVCIGCWVILTGIGGGIVACVCSSNPRKHEFLLYCSISVLILNTINLIFLEFGQVKDIFSENVQTHLGKEYDILVSQNGRIITTVTAIASVLTAFVESQISFCLLNKSQIAHKQMVCTNRKNKALYADNDQSADLEYIIPKKNDSNKKPLVEDTTVQVYAKSWVFEGTAEEENHPDASSLSIGSSSPSHSNAQELNQHNSTQRRISKISDANSERFILQMTSFSRCATPSPVPRSGQTTPTVGNYSDYHDYSAHKTNRLTVEYASATPKLVKSNNQCTASISSQQDENQYASLLAELEKSLIEKKMQAGFSTDNTSLTTSPDKHCSSKSSSKDLEFSKELEAALQLIQELETPSEGPLENAAMSNAHIIRSESEKTLSAAISLPSPEAGPLSLKLDTISPNGKQIIKILSLEPNSQSTSGYSSPNSYSSNLYSIKEFDAEQKNVVKIYIEPKTSFIRTIDTSKHNIESPVALTSSKSNSVNKSFLLFKKRSKLMPQQDFQDRIFKSECLAYLTEEELIERHNINRNIIRKIESNVAQRVKSCQRYN